jgi:hypothetical protein
MFTVLKDGKVRVLVVPERKKEFVHIRNIYGLGKYLVKETDDDKFEYRKRSDFVLGVVIAGILSWLINIFSNLYYDVFLTHNIKLSSYNNLHLVVLLSILFLLIAFLQFLIYDYKNKLTLENNFWKRYLFFVSEDFSPSRLVRFVNIFFISVFLIIFDVSIFFTVNNYTGPIISGAFLFVGIIILMMKDRLSRRQL